jgi:hypothetical protein
MKDIGHHLQPNVPAALTAKWDQVGEGFVRELDFCGVWLRLNENEEGVKDDIIGETKMSATEFLDLCWVSCPRVRWQRQ